MGRWMRTIGLFSIPAATVLALVIGAAAVSADGTMGKSESNPDGNGADKPFVSEGQGTAAASAPASQGPAYFDGNNGCGQDRKHDVAPDHQGGYDDNNGHCGKPADSDVSGESESQHGFKARADISAKAQLKAEIKAAAAAAQQNAAGQANVGAEVAAEAQAKGQIEAAVAAQQAQAAAAQQAQAAAAQQAAVAAQGAAAPAAEGPAAVPALGGNPSSGTPFGTWALLLAAAVSSIGGLALLMRRPI